MNRFKKLLLLVTMMVMTSISVFANIGSGAVGTCKWVIDDDGNLTISPLHGTEGTLYGWYDYPGWCNSMVKTVKFTGTINAETCRSMFYGCENLTSIDFTGFNTSQVKNMNSMLY